MLRYLAILALSLGFASVALAQSGDAKAQEDAKKRMKKGVELFTAKKFEEAIKTFNDALSFVPDAAGPHREIAKCYQQLNNADRTLHHYTIYLERRPDAPERADIESVIPGLREQLPRAGRGSLTLSASPGAMLFWIDASGARTGLGPSPVEKVRVPVGDGRAELVLAGASPRSVPLSVAEGQEYEIIEEEGGTLRRKAEPVALRPELPPSTQPNEGTTSPGPVKEGPKGTAALVVSGVAAASAGFFGVDFMLARIKLLDIGVVESQEELDAAEVQNRRSNRDLIGFWPSALVAVGAGYVGLRQRSKAKEGEAPRASLLVTPQGVALGGRW